MSGSFCSFSPLDGKIVWSGLESEPADIDAAMVRAARAGRSWRATPLTQRLQIARAYQRELEQHRDEIQSLIIRETGKLSWDAAGELNASIAKIELSIAALQQRRGDTTLDSTESAVQRQIQYQPLGVAVVLGPFNFPLHLPGGQIIPALLAGNAVVFKPSEQATAIGCWMIQAWRKAGLPEGVLQGIVGGPAVAARAIDSPHTAAVLLTGSRAAGRAVHRQLAGRPEVLLALELGGNNPLVVTPEVAPETVAAQVTAAAFISAGQRCSCARRAIFIESDSTDAQIEQLVQRTRRLRVGMPGDDPTPELGPLISARAAQRLQHTYDEICQLGCIPLLPLAIDSRAGNLVRPAIVDATELAPDQLSALGELEWFGPLLVVLRVRDFDAAVLAAANTPYGLSAALLGGTRSMFDQFVAGVGAGVVNWNGSTAGAAGTLPFGGRGDSGNHRPAGFFAIDFCSDPVAILARPTPPEDDPWSLVE
jgi:succinylglutamic semialdehyde dehydrogenase